MAQGYTQATPTKLGLLELAPTKPRQPNQPLQLQPAVVFARLPFRGLGTEIERGVKDPLQKKNPKIKQVAEIWRSIEISRIADTGEEYERVLRAVKGVSCSVDELSSVIANLIRFQDEENFDIQAGLFISALIEDGHDRAYTVHTRLFEKKIHFLGCRNKKRVTIIGDTGWGTGYEMECGSVTVIGNVYDTVGRRMRGGTLIVNGDAGQSAGHYMEGGRLMIKGNADRFAGDRMCGGSLIVEQDAGDSAGAGMRRGRLEIYGGAGPEVGGHPQIPMFGDYSGLAMKGGVIRIHGKCESINRDIHGGKIFVGGVQVYPFAVPELVSGSVPEPAARLD